MNRKLFVGLVCLLLGVSVFLAAQLFAKAGTDVYMPLIKLDDGESRYPIMFVTQLPIREDFATIGSTFANHLPTMQKVGRGGDLWIRYPDGSLKNLTALAGYGSIDPSGFQGADAIAVRDPSVHWSGEKAIFSMVVGAPTEQYQYNTYYWQLYEVTGLGQNETPVITKVANQPADYNNIYPIYGTDDQIIFVSDRTPTGERHLYPQKDEYEATPTNTGLWRLNPETGELVIMNHAPSGDFDPLIDSFGRVIFTQWDHLQRDQFAGDDPIDYVSEAADAATESTPFEVFPEPREQVSPDVNGHRFNHFFPWQIREDGTDGEVLNHLGRHELHEYFANNFTNDGNIVEFIAAVSGRVNPNSILNMFHIAEDPQRPGRYFGVDAPEFFTHSAGYIFYMDAAPSDNPDEIGVVFVTPPDPAVSGHYREPLMLSNGRLIAVHTAQTEDEATSGPSIYDFRLRWLVQGNDGFYAPEGDFVTTVPPKTINFWNPDQLVSYAGQLWELNPVEVRPRQRPTAAPHTLAPLEQQMFDEAGVSVAELQAYLEANNLALVISRDVTTRDDADRQQPSNLRVAGSETQTIGAAGTIYDVAHMQFFQGDLIRAYPSRAGRRVLARPLHDPAAIGANMATSGPEGSVSIAADGSMAAFVPANRALSWQLTDPAGEGVVRERYWLTFQPGEIRTCTSCHGLNQSDQAGQSPPQKPPQALLDLLTFWKGNP